jgi:hypothetical protein
LRQAGYGAAAVVGGAERPSPPLAPITVALEGKQHTSHQSMPKQPSNQLQERPDAHQPVL